MTAVDLPPIPLSAPDGVAGEWSGGLFTNGYGQFRAGSRKVKAHRVAYELTHGPIHGGLLVCHRCDNPPCVRPDHLFLGTPADNVHDRDAKGRTSRRPTCSLPGELNPAAKLTPAEVLRIREMKQTGATNQAIGALVGASPSQVGNIVRRKCWRNL